MIVVIVSGVI